MTEPRYQQIFFDPEQHPEDTLKAFEEFIQTFELRYDAQYPDPPKVSMDAAIERWKVANTSTQTPQPKPDLTQYDNIRDEWRARDKVAKFLGMFSSNRLYTDWKVAQPDDGRRKVSKWDDFVKTMKEFYKPTSNITLMNYHFRALSQMENETFPGFCNRVQKEANHCTFKCTHPDCTAEEIAVRDQIIIGTKESSIREEALKKSWDLNTLRNEGMKMESAARSGAEISGEAVNKLSKFSFQNFRRSKGNETVKDTKKRAPISCYNCGNSVTGPYQKHKAQCPAKGAKCKKCSRTGHFTKVCKSPQDLRQVSTSSQQDIEDDDGSDVYQPVLMIDDECVSDLQTDLQKVLTKYPQNFTGLGKLRNHQVKLHVDESVKPVSVPPRSIPYHLQERAQHAINEMVQQDVIEEHPPNEPAPWVSNAVLTPKPTDGSIRVTLDARNVNKAIHATNQPIPRHEDIKAKLAGCKVFSKMDFKSAFWQMELEKESRKLTVFHANNKLYRYKRLSMGIKPAQGELNSALRPVFANIKHVHLIHDDVIIATKTDREHVQAVSECMEAISEANLTLNPPKCHFGKTR